jgi:ribulose-phosphate 3-epimerase
MAYLIAPSILAADMTRLGDEVQAILDAGADMIHFDVMDNHYVPNLTMGPFICQSLAKRFTQLVIDVHLMTNPVDELIYQFAKAGAKRISIHPNATLHLDRSLTLIKAHGCSAGLALNPATSPACLEWCISRLDFVLIMTVNPGFGGQTIIPSTINKISLIKHRYPELAICVDGGVNIDNIGQLARAGACQFVAGSAIFSSKNYVTTFKAMRHQLQVYGKY